MSSPTSPSPGPARPASSRRTPEWAGRNYTLLTGAAVITNLGSHGALIATTWAVLQSGGSPGDVGLVAAARTLPLVLFLLIGGAVADRIPRHHVMVAANALNCLSQAVFALLVLTGDPELWQMMLLTALCGAGTAFFNPAAEGMLMATVSGPQANRAFAFFRMAMNGASVGGAALGGAMVALLGPGWVLAVDAAAFAVAGALRAFLNVGDVPERAPGGGLLTDLREGWGEFRSRPWLWSIVLQFSVVVAVVGAAEAVYGPLVALEQLGGAAPWGVALAFFGLGTIGGAVLMMTWKPRRLLLVGTLCVFPLALPAAGLAVPLPVWGLCAVMFVSGAAIEVFGVSWMTTMHQEIPEEMFSRVSSYDWFGSLSMLPLAMALAGPVESAIGRTSALWGCAGLVIVVTAAVLLVPDVRHMTRKPPAPTGPGAAAPDLAKPSPAASTSAESSPAGV
ncbi:MFS transporter [Streptomyces sp. NBC_00335]|uniref:MFS transporter n=1 Tax=unclassified Streptomyces TaxID=2593676 RepID=UPI002258D5A6|nr:MULTISPECIES: MFS transporter [unclassified Streptomyces]MCX5408693.1 MFS transporter [Streptomyces sp. NBC_00086]